MIELGVNKKGYGGIEIADLDALIDTPLSFRLHGRVHTLEPVRNIVFLRFINGLNQVYKDVESKDIGADAFQETVLKLFQSVCPTITKEDIDKNTQAQTAALFSLVVDHIQGRTQDDKKKIVKH